MESKKEDSKKKSSKDKSSTCIKFDLGLNDKENSKSSVPNSSKFVRRTQKSLTTGPNKSYITTFESSTQTELNPDFHETMEDFTLTINCFNGESYRHLFCIFDGHGGDTTAKLCAKLYPEIFKKCLNQNPCDYELAIKQSFKLMDNEIEKTDSKNAGNTATVVFINNKLLYCANVGDSSCALINDNDANFISTDDKCEDPKETKRIIKQGGIIEEGRLEGILAISRGLGDFDLKGKGLINEPHIFKKLIDVHNKYCVIASDGVWDVLSPKEIQKFSLELLTPELIAKRIVKEALAKGSEDNISCIVIDLNKKLIKI